jgi:hypothetical protein
LLRGSAVFLGPGLPTHSILGRPPDSMANGKSFQHVLPAAGSKKKVLEKKSLEDELLCIQVVAGVAFSHILRHKPIF